MTDEKIPDNLEIEKIKLERLKVYGKIITVLISVGIGTYGVAAINSKLKEKQLEQQELVNKATLQQAEMQNLGKFLKYALTKDVNEQIRFANYFAKLTIDDKVRARWGEYLTDLEILRDSERKLVEEVKSLEKSGEYEKAKEKKTELADIRVQTAQLPDKPERELKRENAGLDGFGVPLKYTKNEYELKNDGLVVYDKATDLTWQQSGSESYMRYNEATNYINKLNNEKFAGYSDWHLPTLEEAKSLLEPSKNKTNKLYIDSIFGSKQRIIWTSDIYLASRAWVVYFDNGDCYVSSFFNDYYVRAVR